MGNGAMIKSNYLKQTSQQLSMPQHPCWLPLELPWEKLGPSNSSSWAWSEQSATLSTKPSSMKPCTLWMQEDPQLSTPSALSSGSPSQWSLAAKFGPPNPSRRAGQTPPSRSLEPSSCGCSGPPSTPATSPPITSNALSSSLIQLCLWLEAASLPLQLQFFVEVDSTSMIFSMEVLQEVWQLEQPLESQQTWEFLFLLDPLQVF